VAGKKSDSQRGREPKKTTINITTESFVSREVVHPTTVKAPDGMVKHNVCIAPKQDRERGSSAMGIATHSIHRGQRGVRAKRKEVYGDNLRKGGNVRLREQTINQN